MKTPLKIFPRAKCRPSFVEESAQTAEDGRRFVGLSSAAATEDEEERERGREGRGEGEAFEAL